MNSFMDFINMELILKILRTVIIVLFFYLFFRIIFKRFRKKFLAKAKSKKERSNVKIFFRTTQYFLVFLLMVFAFISYGGSFAGMGLAVGFLTAALGLALQRPITGIAAWLMVVIKRPFEIGDRIIIGTIKGDVLDVTLSHIHIDEIGGTISAEESSGRIILVPNAKLFDEAIVNYTKEDENILDEVKFPITYGSNLEKAKEIAKKAAINALEKIGEKTKTKEPYLRIWFQPSGMDVVVRYFVKASIREEARSQITQEIFEKVRAVNDVEFAYPHTEVVFRKK